jgi:predicted O-linked N-acetylglucosamine transferase (SPINDLY family)
MEHLAKDPNLSLHVYNNHIAEDDYTQLLRNCADEWQQITGMPDAQLANKIRDERIDILFDLSGHTGRNRLLTFARKPAPIQVTWMGYPGTTGLSAMDYYLADKYGVPFGPAENLFSEEIVHLPSSATFLPEQSAPPVNILPAMHNGYITFGSFNRPNKLSANVIGLWAGVLHAVPTARMLVGGLPDEARNIVTDWFAQHRIASDRLVFRPRSLLPVYLAQHHDVDLCLDTFPYGGSTTTFNAAWMGVPTLTLPGRTVAGRGGAMIMSSLGLEAFIASDEADFVANGVHWASDMARLTALRDGMRDRCTGSAYFQPGVVAAAISRALRLMWERWSVGLPPVRLDVTQPVEHEAST